MFVAIPLFETIIESLKYCCTNKCLNLHAYKNMMLARQAAFSGLRLPNHAYYIVSTDPPEKLSDIMRDYNRFTSQRITNVLDEMHRIELLETFREAAVDEGRGNRFKVRQEGFHPIAIDTGDFFQQKLDYLHENPVRKGFVKKPEYWLYSSARCYLFDDHSVIQVQCLE